MTLTELYDRIGGNYSDVMGRLMTEQRVKKYLFKLSGTGDYEGALEALKSQNWPDFFRFTHNLKGVSLNLGLTSLANVSAYACDLVRNGAPTEDPVLAMAKITEVYNTVLSEIAAFQAEEQ